MTKRKQHKPDFKAPVALEALKGEQTVERDFFGTRAASASRQERKVVIRPDHPTLSVVRQCRLAPISHSTFYHVPRARARGTSP